MVLVDATDVFDRRVWPAWHSLESQKIDGLIGIWRLFNLPLHKSLQMSCWVRAILRF